MNVVNQLIVNRYYRKRRRFAQTLVLTMGVAALFERIEAAPAVVKSRAASVKRHQKYSVKRAVIAKAEAC